MVNVNQILNVLTIILASTTLVLILASENVESTQIVMLKITQFFVLVQQDIREILLLPAFKEEDIHQKD